MTVIELKDNKNCFVCGKLNSHGLQLTWETRGETSRAVFYPSKTHQGWDGLVHGGILSTVLDEAMTRLAWETWGPVVTAELSIRFFNPARIGEKLIVTGEIPKSSARIIQGKGEIRNKQGRLIAAATSKIVRFKNQST